MPRPTVAHMPNGEAIRTDVERLLDLTVAELETISSPETSLSRHFAALALARTVRLIRAMLVLRAAELEDVADVPLRQVAEHATLGMYLVYGGQHALDHMRGSHVYDLGLVDRAGEPPPAILDTWQGPRDRIKWQDLMHNVVPDLVVAATCDTSARDAFRTLYDGIYRGQSLLVAHAGVGTVARHIVNESDGTRRVDPAGYLIEDGTAAIMMAGALLGLLCTHVLMAFDRDPAEAWAISERLIAPHDVLVDGSNGHTLL